MKGPDDDGLSPELIGKMLDQLPPEIKNEFHSTAYEIMANEIIKSGLRVEDHCRVTDQGFALTKQAIKAIAATGFPAVKELGEGNDDLDGLGIGRSAFIHSLSEYSPDGDHMNLWGLASLIISAAQGWIPGEKPTQQALEMLTNTVFKASPTTDVNLLLARARYDDRALLKLASLLNEGLNASVVKK